MHSKKCEFDDYNILFYAEAVFKNILVMTI